MNNFSATANAAWDYSFTKSLATLVAVAESNFLCPVGMPGTKDERRYKRPSNLSNGECRA